MRVPTWLWRLLLRIGLVREWEVKNQRTVRWNKEQSAYLLAKLGSRAPRQGED